MKLDDLRRQIDRIDRDLVRLLNARTRLAIRIGQIKQHQGVPVFVPEREREVFARVGRANRGPLPDGSLRHIYREIMSAARAMEGDLKVSHAATSATAARARFGHSIRYVRCASAAAAAREVGAGRVHFAVVREGRRALGPVCESFDVEGARYHVLGPGPNP